jgi:hypothetical protein
VAHWWLFFFYQVLKTRDINVEAASAPLEVQGD